MSAYGSEIDGNGYAIYNFRISRSQRGRLSEYIGLFERITDNAYIHDITFRDFTVTEVNEGAPTDISVGIFAGSVSSGARFENVTGERYRSVHDSGRVRSRKQSLHRKNLRK